jgi:peptidoglycan/LPS O-acetylase OafA/YrhL
LPEKSPPIIISPGSTRPYYPALDGLRGIAILLVIVYHNFGFINYSSFGWLGVDLFFVLSGFLITDILLTTVGQKNFLGNFYSRRALRIFPLYFLALLVFLIILPRTGLFPDSDYYVENQAWLWTYLQNWLYIFKGDDSTVTLHHLWSLAVEEQFYLLWPLLILLIRNKRMLLYLMMAVLLAVLVLRWWIWSYEIAELSYYRLYTFTRIDGLCIGSMVAILQRTRPGFLKKNTALIALVFAALNFAFFFINRKYEFSFPYLALAGYTTFAMMFGLLVNETVSGENALINKTFGIPPLRFVGRISYGLYIIHWPLYILWRPGLTQWVAERSSPLYTPFIVSLIATLSAVALAWLSFRFFESHFLNLKKRFR